MTDQIPSAATQTAEQARQDELMAFEIAGFLSQDGIEKAKGVEIGKALLHGYQITRRPAGSPVTETTKQDEGVEQ